MALSQQGAFALHHQRRTLYLPQQRPGFTAWAAAFDYGDGRLGLSFKETLQARDPNYRPPLLEYGEAVGAPVSYCSVECGSRDQRSFRVYMLSEDGGQTYRESGRCPIEEGAFCSVGFPDGRIVGLETPRKDAAGSGCGDGILVRESRDGGTTWQHVTKLLEGCAPYLWRVRRLGDGSFLLLASLYGTPWGPGRARATRNTMLPGETCLNKIQTFFLHSRDGVHYSGPHYVLPGIGAHEYDAAELSDGSLLFLAGDIQATPAARQIVRREGERFINGPLLPIRRGAPADPAADPQGGFLPETFVCLPGDLLVGARRNKPYACSADRGENWFEIEGLPSSLYQPSLQLLPDGSLACFGHIGGDLALGQADMYIAADFFRVEGHPPAAAELSLERLLSPEGSQYRNAYAATLTQDGRPLAGRRVVFRFNPYWRADGTVSTLPQEEAPHQIEAVTDSQGRAETSVPDFDRTADIHFAYQVDAWFPGEEALLPCRSPLRCELAMTPRRRCRRPYPVYLAGGVLYVSWEMEERFPGIYQLLEPQRGLSPAASPEALPADLIQALLDANALRRDQAGRLAWCPSVHAPAPLADVKPMGDGDWYE